MLCYLVCVVCIVCVVFIVWMFIVGGVLLLVVVGFLLVCNGMSVMCVGVFGVRWN